MSKEIKFRGKRIDNGEWVYGFYVADVEWAKYYIYFIEHSGVFITMKPTLVDPKTVGQFTGQKDLDDKEVYDGDICEYEDSDRAFESIYLNRGVVEFSEWGFGLTNRNEVDMADIEGQDILVIGNI